MGIEWQAPQLVVEKKMEQLVVVSIERRDYRIVSEVGHALDSESGQALDFIFILAQIIVNLLFA